MIIDATKMTEQELETLRRRLGFVPLGGEQGEVLAKASMNSRDSEWSSGAGMLMYMWENFK